jgi:hypothetical protein
MRDRSRSARRTAAALAIGLALSASGCVTGHVLQAGRRREYAREIESVSHEGGDTVVRYTASVVDDAGDPCGVVERTVRLPGVREAPALRELTRTRTEPWAYALVPVALAADAVVTPTLILMSPAVLVVGD